MDFDLLPQMVIVLSVAGILFIVGKNLSKIKEAAQEEVFSAESDREKREKEKFMYLYERAIRRIDKKAYEQKMAAFWLWMEKFLRKVRLVVMKLDGKMVAALERLRQKNIRTVDEWKKMAETAEKNIQKGQGLFVVPKGAFRKLRKTEPESGEIIIGEEDDSLAKEPMMPLDAQMPVISQKEEAVVEAEIVPAEEAAPIAPEMPYEEETYPEAEAAETVEQEKEEIILQQEKEPQETIVETMPEANPVQAQYAQDDLAKPMKEDIASVIERIEEFAEELEGSELFASAVEDTVEAMETAEAVQSVGMAAMEKQGTAEDTEETNVEQEEVESEKDSIRTRKEQECIEILMKDPADIKAYWKLGIIYSKRRNYEDALACFRQIVKIDPTYTKAKQKVIEVMEKMKKRGK